MQAGTQMIKLRGGSKGLVRFYYLDEHKSCIRWRPSRKNERAKSECQPQSHLLLFLLGRISPSYGWTQTSIWKIWFIHRWSSKMLYVDFKEY